MMRFNRTRRIATFLSLSAVLLLAGCTSKKVQPAAKEKEAVPVLTATVVQKTVPLQVRAIGTVEAYSTVSIKAQVGGQVKEVHFKEGQDVKKGDLLFTIAPQSYEATLKQAEANLARDMAQAADAEVQAQRGEKLVEQGIIPKEQYDQRRAAADALQAAVQADRAAVDYAKIQLSYCYIYSPLNGRTGNLMVNSGNLVKANDVPILLVINQVQPIYVDVALPEQYLAEIKKHMAAGKLKMEAFLPDDKAHPEVGLLTFVDNAVDRTTGTIHVKATFTNPARRLWPGQFVDTVLTLADQPNTIVVPSQAIQTGQSGQFVFVVKSDLTAESRPVVVGRSLDGETVVEKGLQAGEKVVTDGQHRLIPGAKVELKSSV